MNCLLKKMAITSLLTVVVNPAFSSSKLEDTIGGDDSDIIYKERGDTLIRDVEPLPQTAQGVKSPEKVSPSLGADEDTIGGDDSDIIYKDPGDTLIWDAL